MAMPKMNGLAALVFLATATLAQAQYRGPPAGYGPPDGTGNGFGSGDGSFGNGVGFDIEKATNYRTIHGVLAAMAFVIFFPVGAIAMRVIPGRSALWVHAVTQLGAHIFFICAAALGIWLVTEVRIPIAGGSPLDIASVNYHPIIGLVIFAALFFQPILGLIHHSRFKRLRRRQIWSHLHLWNGRIMIPLGIINGGLGLRVAGASSQIKAAYAAVAGILGGLWILVALISEARRKSARWSAANVEATREASIPAVLGREEREKTPDTQQRVQEDSRSSSQYSSVLSGLDDRDVTQIGHHA